MTRTIPITLALGAAIALGLGSVAEAKPSRAHAGGIVPHRAGTPHHAGTLGHPIRPQAPHGAIAPKSVDHPHSAAVPFQHPAPAHPAPITPTRISYTPGIVTQRLASPQIGQRLDQRVR